MDRPDSDKWLEAMRSELQSMYDNTVWNLVVPLDGMKPITNKWVFKRKTDMDGKYDCLQSTTGSEKVSNKFWELIMMKLFHPWLCLSQFGYS